MPVSAYVLINTTMGQAAEVAKAISEINGVKKVECVTGQIDIIAFVESENINDLGKVVANQIQKIPGIIGTITCPVVELG